MNCLSLRFCVLLRYRVTTLCYSGLDMTVSVSSTLEATQDQMEALRTLSASLGLLDAQPYVRSGNVTCRTEERDFNLLTNRIENGIEKSFGFRPDVADARDGVLFCAS